MALLILPVKAEAGPGFECRGGVVCDLAKRLHTCKGFVKNYFMQRRNYFSCLGIDFMQSSLIMEIREKIEAYLADSGDTQSALAKKAGVHPSLINRILKGKQQDFMGKNLERVLRVVSP